MKNLSSKYFAELAEIVAENSKREQEKEK